MHDLKENAPSDTVGARAVEKGWEVLDRIRAKGDAIIDVLTPHHITGEPVRAWHPLGLDPGDLGMALVYSAADGLRPDDGWDRLAFTHVQRMIEGFSTTPDLGIGLFSGTAGVAYALRSLDRDGTRYLRAIHDVDAVLATRVESRLKELPGQAGISTGAYDVIAGLSGAALYILQTAAWNGRLARTGVAIIEEFCRLALDTPPNGFWTPSNQITEFERETSPRLRGGYLNLGYAHGIAGVLSVLGRASARGVDVARLDDAIVTLTKVLTDSLQDTEYGPDVPYHRLSADQPATQPELSRTAWCYGNLGLALALSNADIEQNGIVRGLVRSVHDRPLALRFMGNPSLCHGIGGQLSIERHLGLAKLPADYTPDVTIENLLDFADDRMEFGFANEQQEGRFTDSPGFLEGSGGVAVALISLESEEPSTAEKMLLGDFTC